MKATNTLYLRAGDLVIVNITNGIGHQQNGRRVAVVVSNNIGNRKSPTVKIIPGTTKRNNSKLPTHAHFKKGECGLLEDTTFEAESEWVINKFQVEKIIGKMDEEGLSRIAAAMVYAVPLVQMAFERGIQREQQFEYIANYY